MWLSHLLKMLIYHCITPQSMYYLNIKLLILTLWGFSLTPQRKTGLLVLASAEMVAFRYKSAISTCMGIDIVEITSVSEVSASS